MNKSSPIPSAALHAETGPRRRSVLLAAGAGAAGGLLGAPAIVRAQNNVIKVGSITTASGRAAVLGVATRRGIQMEMDRINAAGGLDGRKLQLVERDSKGAPDVAASQVRELIASEGCEIILDCDSSAAAFAVHEVFRSAPNVLGVHCVSETSQLSADPKMQLPNVFRIARQGIHDTIAGSKFAADICKQRGLTKWATVSADYSFGRQTTPEFLQGVSTNGAKVDVVAQTWPKLSQPDYTENITAIARAQPEVIYTTLFGGDLTAFLDQAAVFGLFEKTLVFSNFIADYTTISVLKSVPKEIYGANRYLSEFPATPENRAWGQRFQQRFNEHPTNWTWQAATAMSAIMQAMVAAKSASPQRLMKVLPGMEIVTPLGARQGKAILRASDRTLTHYALGWGRAQAKAPYLTGIVESDWDIILRQEADWKKQKGYA